MTDNEIKKALEEVLKLMLCDGDLQRSSTISNALDYINRLEAQKVWLENEIIDRNNAFLKVKTQLLTVEAEIQAHKERLHNRKAEVNRLNSKVRGLKAENEQLKNNLKAMTETMAQCECCNIAKVEAYKEFAERLKIRFAGTISCNSGAINNAANKILKELVGDAK